MTLNLPVLLKSEIVAKLNRRTSKTLSVNSRWEKEVCKKRVKFFYEVKSSIPVHSSGMKICLKQMNQFFTYKSQISVVDQLDMKKREKNEHLKFEYKNEHEKIKNL